MQSTKSIPKIGILSFLIIVVLISSLMLNTINVHAADDVLVEGHCADSDVTASDGKWYSTYGVDVGYKGQGVLVYLIERNGGGPVAGTMPKAYACDDRLLSYPLHAQDKFDKYPEVTTWEEPLPYWAGSAGKAQNGGIIRSSTKSNLDEIKGWLTEDYPPNSTNGIWMVQSIWGQSAGQRFINEEIILIVEPIVAIEFANCKDTGFTEEIAAATNITELISAIDGFRQFVSLYNSTTKISKDLDEALDYWRDSLEGAKNASVAGSYTFTGVKQAMEKAHIGDKVYTKNYVTAKPACGTPKKILDAYASYVPQQSMGMTWSKTQAGIQYFRRAAHQSAYIDSNTVVCKDAIPAGNLWPAGASVKKSHTDDDIRNKTIGMFAMLAWTTDGDDGQTTCDEPEQPSPHQPPAESKGNCTIIKSYREKDDVTGAYTDHGTYYRQQVANKIIIENESEFKLKAWKTSSSPNLNISSLTWETSVPAVIGQTGTAPTTIELPDGQPYLYLLPLITPIGVIFLPKFIFY